MVKAVGDGTEGVTPSVPIVQDVVLLLLRKLRVGSRKEAVHDDSAGMRVLYCRMGQYDYRRLH